jgi:hypothetical protein
MGERRKTNCKDSCPSWGVRVAELVKELPFVYGYQTFITVFTRTFHSSRFHLDESNLLDLRNIPFYISHKCRTLSSSTPLLFDHPNEIMFHMLACLGGTAFRGL